MRAALPAIFLLTAATLFSYSSGPDSGNAGVPGESTCSSCHGGTAGFARVTVTFPGAMTYAPGATQHLIVTVADPQQMRWGFQLTARSGVDSATPGGTFSPGSDGFTQVVCVSANFIFQAFAKNCSDHVAQYPLQYIEHTLAGTRPGQAGSAQFAFDWTPPANAGGNITIYVAANAANNSDSDTGDHICTAQYTLTPAVAAPVISTNGVLNAAGFQNTISAGSWVAIEGSNLSATTRTWQASDFVNGALPTQLDGVQVTINGKPAFLEYVSPGLVNVQAPTDTATGPVAVQVKNGVGTSGAVLANLQTVSPAFFLWNSKYVAATRPDYSLVGPSNLFPGTTTNPARPGDVIVLWGNGFGPANPLVPAGVNTPSDTLHSVASPVTLLLGNLTAEVLSAVLTPGNAGVYQIAIRIPSNAPAGDLPVVSQVGGVQSSPGALLTVTP